MGAGASADNSTADGRLVFGILAALAGFARALNIAQTKTGLVERAHGQKGGAPFKITPSKLRLAQASIGMPEIKVGDPCAELGVARQTLDRFADPRREKTN